MYSVLQLILQSTVLYSSIVPSIRLNRTFTTAADPTHISGGPPA